MPLKFLNQIASTVAKAHADSKKPKKPKAKLKPAKEDAAEEAAESPEFEAGEDSGSKEYKKGKK